MCPRITTSDRLTAVLLVVHVSVMFGGFLVLGPAFEFPEVLRYPAAERFAIFTGNQTVIRPTYWALTMTGISQILLSVLLFHVAGRQSQVAATLSLVFGTLAGLCQALGFGRWVILVPYLAAESMDPAKAGMAAMLEGAFNHYAGMLVGEHLANICWGIWLASICVALLGATNINRGLAWFGISLSPLLFLLAGEQIGVSGAVLDPLVDFGFPLLAVWHLLLAAQMWRRNGAGKFALMGRRAWVTGSALAIGMILPAFA